MPRSVFHIGYMKTATTLLQSEVFPALEACAFYSYPSQFPHRAYAVRDNPADREWAALVADMRGWIEQSPAPLQLFSWEGLVGDYLGDYRDRATMLGLMHAVAPQAHVVLVIRRQAELANSLYKQALHRGHWPTVEAFLNYADGALGPFREGRVANMAVASLDFDATVRTYEQAFGPERVHVLAYEWLRSDPDRFYGALETALDQPVPRPQPGKALNVGYNTASARLARRLNRAFRTPHNPHGILPYRPFETARLRAAPGSLRRKLLTLANAPFDPRWPLQGWLGARLKGSPDLIPAAVRTAIDAACASSNAALDVRRGLGLRELGVLLTMRALAPVIDAMRGRLAKTTGAVFLLRGANVGLNFVIAALLARWLGPSGYGQYSVVLALLTTLAIPAQCGIPALVIREVSRARADKAVWRFRDITRWAHGLTFLIGVPMLGLTVLAALVPNPMVPQGEAAMLLAGAAMVLMLPLRALRSGLIRGLDRVVLGQIPGQVVQPILQLGFVLLLVLAPGAVGYAQGLTPLSAMLANTAAVVLAWVFGGFILLHLLRGVEQRPGERWVVPGWKGAIMAFGLTNAMVLIDQQIGLLVLVVTSPDAQAGFYKVASQAATFTAMGYVAANMALGPGVAKQWREGQFDAVQAAVVRGSRLSALFAFPVSVFFLVAGGLFLEIVFGADYLPAWPAMALLVLAQFANCAFGSNTVLLNMSGNERENTKAFAVALSVNVALAFALAPRFGATGAAAAAAASVVLRNLILWRAAHRLCGMETGFWGRVPKAAETN